VVNIVDLALSQFNNIEVLIYYKYTSWLDNHYEFGGNNNKQLLLTQLLWIVVSFGISLTISKIIPFPLSLAVILGVFIVINMYVRRMMLRKMGSMGVGTMFDSIFRSNQNTSSLKYYCMSCGTQHTMIECPKCGSKMKRVGP